MDIYLIGLSCNEMTKRMRIYERLDIVDEMDGI
jgi:hypothetical protein